MGEWIKCSERMPRDKQIVYISYRPADPATACAYLFNGQWIAAGVFYNLRHDPGPFEFRQTIIKDEVTSWHLLPEIDAPEADQ